MTYNSGGGRLGAAGAANCREARPAYCRTRTVVTTVNGVLFRSATASKNRALPLLALVLLLLYQHLALCARPPTPRPRAYYDYLQKHIKARYNTNKTPPAKRLQNCCRNAQGGRGRAVHPGAVLFTYIRTQQAVAHTYAIVIRRTCAVFLKEPPCGPWRRACPKQTTGSRFPRRREGLS